MEPLVYIKSYIFRYFYQQYLVLPLLTMVPRNSVVLASPPGGAGGGGGGEGGGRELLNIHEFKNTPHGDPEQTSTYTRQPRNLKAHRSSHTF